jgi:hypothetical protein
VRHVGGEVNAPALTPFRLSLSLSLSLSLIPKLWYGQCKDCSMSSARASRRYTARLGILRKQLVKQLNSPPPGGGELCTLHWGCKLGKVSDLGFIFHLEALTSD